jgi:pimeloyl-ACP methyl ester carboxylesterase
MATGKMTEATEVGKRGKTIRLSDGRRLGFMEWGDPHGAPVLEFRGLPSSRLGDAIDPGFLLTHHIRRITVDRPGTGASDSLPGRTLLDWPQDVAELAGALGIGQFTVLGTSGGGPYAAACAYRLPGRVARVALMSGLGPLDRPGAGEGMNAGEHRMMVLSRNKPLLARALAGFAVAADRTRPGMLIRGLARALPECDRSVMAQPQVRASLMDSYQRAFAQGTRGQVHDWGVIAAPWGFRPQEITIEVQLWQGDQDDRVPPHHAQYLADVIPRSHLTMLRGEGHMIAFTRIEQALTHLTADQAARHG